MGQRGRVEDARSTRASERSIHSSSRRARDVFRRYRKDAGGSARTPGGRADENNDIRAQGKRRARGIGDRGGREQAGARDRAWESSRRFERRRRGERRAFGGIGRGGG